MASLICCHFGTVAATKRDEFSEKFQTAFDHCPPHFWIEKGPPLELFKKIIRFASLPTATEIFKEVFHSVSNKLQLQKFLMILRRWAVTGKYYTWVVFGLDFPPSVLVAECLVHPWSSQVPGEGLIPGETLRIGNPSLQNAKTFFTHTCSGLH